MRRYHALDQQNGCSRRSRRAERLENLLGLIVGPIVDDVLQYIKVAAFGNRIDR